MAPPENLPVTRIAMVIGEEKHSLITAMNVWVEQLARQTVFRIAMGIGAAAH
jgi:hypothetical protein